jgi:putative endonuclease
MSGEYYVYIMASKSRVIYTGVTNDLARRVWEHKQKLIPGFTHKHNVTKLVYFEKFDRIEEAIAREKVIKGWLRRKKIALIEGRNGAWRDLAYGWFGAEVLRCAQDDSKEVWT